MRNKDEGLGIKDEGLRIKDEGLKCYIPHPPSLIPHPSSLIPKKIISFVLEITRKIIGVSLIIGSIFFLRWIGLKGILGLTLGMGVMAYLILSENFVLYGILRTLTGKNYETNIIKEEIREERKHKVKFN